jgi:hypothetical protein
MLQVTQRLGIDRVEPPRAYRSDGREPALAQDPKVLRHGGL